MSTIWSALLFFALLGVALAAYGDKIYDSETCGTPSVMPERVQKREIFLEYDKQAKIDESDEESSEEERNARRPRFVFGGNSVYMQDKQQSDPTNERNTDEESSDEESNARKPRFVFGGNSIYMQDKQPSEPANERNSSEGFSEEERNARKPRFVFGGNSVYMQDKQPSDPANKLNNGSRVKREAKAGSKNPMPWAASLSIDDGSGESICGATLISQTHVLTVAHCFRKIEGGLFCDGEQDAYTEKEIIDYTTVYVGGLCRSPANADQDQTQCRKKEHAMPYRVKKVSPMYLNYFNRNCEDGDDLMVLELIEPVPEYLHHACMPFVHQILQEDKDMLFYSFGWGSDPNKNYTTLHFPRLQAVDLGKLIEKENCVDDDGSHYPDDVICFKEEQNRNVCEGDSGGGLMTVIGEQHFVFGAVSMGTRCKALLDGVAPGIQTFTDIRRHADDVEDFLMAYMGEDAETYF